MGQCGGDQSFHDLCTLVSACVSSSATPLWWWAWENTGVPQREETTETGLDHVVVVGGTPAQWLSMSDVQWRERLESVAVGAAAGGAKWITVFPHHGNSLQKSDEELFRRLMLSTATGEYLSTQPRRFVWRRNDDVTVIVDSSPNGRERFARTIEELRVAGTDPQSLTEESVSYAILSPATHEADLVVVIGPPDRIPHSLIWELAYSELVFLDMNWEQLMSSHLELAIDDFNRRHRRFGGLDS